MESKRISVGTRLRFFRQQKGLTQEQLGLLVGFPVESAGIRISQYESDSRQPKEELLCALSTGLGISKKALNAPTINNTDDLMHLLFILEDAYGIVPLIQFGSDETLNCAISAWDDKFELLEAGRITPQEYNNWRWNYSSFEDSDKADSLDEYFAEAVREAHLAINDLVRMIDKNQRSI